MNMQTKKIKEYFNQMCEDLFTELPKGQVLNAKIAAEETLFARINHSKVRQVTHVVQGSMSLSIYSGKKVFHQGVTLSFDPNQDVANLKEVLSIIRREVEFLPDDPFLVLPSSEVGGVDIHEGKLLGNEDWAKELLAPVAGIDFVGIYAGGTIMRGSCNSLGGKNWFSTENFSMDYSLFSKRDDAVKGVYAGPQWNDQKYRQNIEQDVKFLQLLSGAKKTVPRGKYKTYLAPMGVMDLVGMASWGAVSGASFKKGTSAFEDLINEKRSFSEKINLAEDFSSGVAPRFNNLGEVSQETIPVIASGKMKNLLVSSKTEKEFGLKGNGASQWEGMRSPVLAPGSLERDKIVSEIGEGLYLSNIHYTNWSDRKLARVTGMTRYACFWVENGQLKAPIENLRFDISLYEAWGEDLVDLTSFQEVLPSVETYDMRQPGGGICPGMLIDQFNYTL